MYITFRSLGYQFAVSTWYCWSHRRVKNKARGRYTSIKAIHMPFQSTEVFHFLGLSAILRARKFFFRYQGEVDVKLNPSLWGCHPCLAAAILEKGVQMDFMVYWINYWCYKNELQHFFVANKILYNLGPVTFIRRTIINKVMKGN